VRTPFLHARFVLPVVIAFFSPQAFSIQLAGAASSVGSGVGGSKVGNGPSRNIASPAATDIGMPAVSSAA
jgi:hypothetical protein